MDIFDQAQSEDPAKPATEYNGPLLDLAERVRVDMTGVLKQMKEHVNDSFTQVELYYHLKEVLLSLEYWNDDIVVEGESALETIKKDESGFAVIALRLRGHFNDMESKLLQLRGNILKE